MLRTLLFSLILLFSSCAHLAGDGDKESDGLTREQRRESKRINEFFENIFEENIERSPMAQSYLGRKTQYDQLDDRSEQRALEDQERSKKHLQQLRNDFDYDLLPHQDQLSYRLLEERLENGIESFQYRYHWYPINQMYGTHSQLPSFMINTHRVENESDARAYIARLNQFKQQFEYVIERLERAEKKGIIAPSFVFPKVLSDSENIISGAPFDKSNQVSPLYEDFERKVLALDLEQEYVNDLLAGAEHALIESVGPGYAMLIEKLKELQKKAPEQGTAVHLPDGENFYALRLKQMTTTDMTPDEIHQMGLEQTARIHDEMREVIEEVGFEGDLQDFFEFMRTSPKFRYPDTKQGREDYIADTHAIINRMKDFLPEIFGILPVAELDIRAVEPFREQSAGLAFYQGPSEDGSRPGIYYINLYDMDAVDTYTQEALAYHEGLPGHHMQIAIATELEGVPKFRKHGNYTAYSEGWGLYSEYIPYEYGFYEDPYSNFGRLAMELHRSARLVVDTGLHHKGWTIEEAVAWLKANTSDTHREILRSAQRYVIMPGQATAYMVGMRKILDLKDLAESELGERFDIRGFHDEILRDGPVPLSILEEKIEAWIEGQKV